MPPKTVAQNRRARFDYEILETVEAGVMLTGQEVKSCRMGHVNLAGAYVTFVNGKPVLKKAKISLYAFATATDYDPERDRPLLLKKNEVEKLQSQTETKGITVIPLEVRAGKYIKVVLGLGRGRKNYDKRNKIKEKDIDRKMKQGREY